MADEKGAEGSSQDRVRLVQRSEADAALRSGAALRRRPGAFDEATPKVDPAEDSSESARESVGEKTADKQRNDKQRNDQSRDKSHDDQVDAERDREDANRAAFVTPPDPSAEVHSSAGSTRAVLAGGDTASPSAVERVSTTFRSASMKQRALTAALFAAAALAAAAGGPTWTMLLVGVVLTVCGFEFFDAVRRVGFRPATVLGVAGTVGVIFGSYLKGEAAIPLLSLLVMVFSMLWFLAGVSKAPATINIAITVFGFAYVGIGGAHAALLLRIPDHRGLALFIGAVVVTIAYDTAAYIGGSTFGKHHLARDISPNKTWEGLAIATVAAVLVGALGVGFIHPWSPLTGLMLGLVVAVVAPIGDLAESMIKRDLGIKDMGRILPGHGGLLDRSDAMLLVLPATYYLALVANIGQ